MKNILNPQKLSWYERGLTIFVGGLSAMYMTPFTVSVFSNLHDVSVSAQLFLGFLIGYSGLKSIEVAIVEIKKRFNKKLRLMCSTLNILTMVSVSYITDQ